MNKEDLIKFLKDTQVVGKWLSIAKQFNVPGTPKQQSDFVRRLYKKVKKENSIVNFVQVQGEKNLSDIKWTTTTSSTTWYPLEGHGHLSFSSRKEKIKKSGIHLVLACVHVPFHNKVLLNKLLNFIEDQRDNIIGFHLIGDYLDMRSLSSYDDKTITLSGLTLGKEYKEGNRVLDLFEAVLPEDIQKTFIYGNHENRYDRYVSNVKNYKTADTIQSPYEALCLEDRGYKVLTNWQDDYFTVGKYQLFHGTTCSINPSKTNVDKLRTSCIFGHTHRINQHYEGWLHGVNIGCLADLTSDTFGYASRVEKFNWKNGFGIINVSGKYSQAEVIVCEDNGFFYQGKRY